METNKVGMPIGVPLTPEQFAIAVKHDAQEDHKKTNRNQQSKESKPNEVDVNELQP